MTSKALKPCAKCGSQSQLKPVNAWARMHYQIICHKCGARTALHKSEGSDGSQLELSEHAEGGSA